MNNRMDMTYIRKYKPHTTTERQKERERGREGEGLKKDTLNQRWREIDKNLLPLTVISCV